ncbi:toxin Cry1Ac domain D-VI-related protein, partial [Listeria booriae]
MNRKKIVSVLTVSTLVGSTLASPITVMAQEQPAQQTVSKANKTTKSVPVNVRSIENPELFKVSSSVYTHGSYYRFDAFDTGDMNQFSYSKSLGSTRELSMDIGQLFMALRVDEEKQEFGMASFKKDTIQSWPAYVEQSIDTEVGKEYTFKTDVRMDINGYGNSKPTIVTVDVFNDGYWNGQSLYAYSNKVNSASITFKATSTSTRIRIQRDYAEINVKDFTMFSGITVKKSDKQVEIEKQEIDAPNQKAAREAVNNLFENKNPLGNIVTGLIQQDITNAQNLVNQVEDATQKAALQKDLDEAQKQLDARNAAAAEKARQEAAETSVKELFNNNDVTGSIKDSTNQAAIDNAQQKVDAVTDSTKKAELQKNLDEAQRQFDVNYEYRLKGLGDNTFATIDISTQKMWADINIKAGAPHVYFADTYASIVIQDKAGNEKYAKTFIGVDTNQASTVRVPLAIGDEITTYHREATSGSTDRLEIQNEKTKAYLEAATTITYVVTSQGLVVKTEVQAQDKAREAVNNLFENKDSKGKITDSLTQAEIDVAQGLVDQVKDTTQKAELQKDLDEAQKQLDARNVAAAELAAEKARQEVAETSVKELFNNNDVTGSIKDSTNQAAIDNAQQKVDAVTDSTKKAELQKNLDEAQRQFDVNYEYRFKGLGDFTFATIDISMQKMWADIDIKAGAPHVYFANNYAAILIQDKAGNIKYTKFFMGTDINQASTVRVPLAIGDEITTYHREATSGSTDRLEIQNEKTKAYLEAATTITYVVTSQGLVAKTEVQAQDKAREAVNNLFENKDSKGKITDSLTQAEIDVAQGLVDQVKDTTQKAELQKDLDEAQKQLTAKKEAEEKEAEEAAKKAVDELFQDNKPTTGAINDTTNQDAIDAAQDFINQVTDADKKAALQKDLDKAQELLDAKLAAEKEAEEAAKKAVDELFQDNKPTTG